MLDAHCLPYYVRHLNIADYMFLVRGPGCGLGGQQLPARDRVAPVLVERKSVEDVAGSIADGRWQAQQRRMLQVCVCARACVRISVFFAHRHFW